MSDLKDVITPLTAFVASFAGAWAAFRFAAHTRAAEEEKKNTGAGNRAIYCVYALWNVLEQYRKEVLEPFRTRPDAWLNLAAHPVVPVVTDRFDPAELQFLLEKSCPEVFTCLMLEQQRFELALGLIKARTELVLDSVFPKMAAAGFGVGQKQDQAAVEQALGIDLCHQLKQLTGAIFQNVGQDLASLQVAYGDLRQGLIKIYPKRQFLKVVFEIEKKGDKGGAAV